MTKTRTGYDKEGLLECLDDSKKWRGYEDNEIWRGTVIPYFWF